MGGWETVNRKRKKAMAHRCLLGYNMFNDGAIAGHATFGEKGGSRHEKDNRTGAASGRRTDGRVQNV